MSIENDFNSAEIYLEMAKEKWQRGQYCASLVNLSKAYPYMRSLIEEIYKLDREGAAAALSEEEFPG